MNTQSATQRPLTIRWALYLAFIGIIASMVPSFVAVAHAPERSSKPVLICMYVVIHAVQVAVTYCIAQGHQWARYLFIIGAGLILLGVPRGTPKTVTNPAMIAHWWFQWALVIAIAWLLLLPSSAQWFRERSAPAKR